MGWSKYSEDNDGFSEERLTNTYGAGKYSYNFNHYWTSETAKASDCLRHLRNQPRRNPFVEVNHQRVKLATEQFSKITSLKLCYYGNAPADVSLLVDKGLSSQDRISFRTVPKKKEYDLFQQIPHKGFYTLCVSVDNLSFEIQQKIQLSNLTTKEIQAHIYPLARFEDAFTDRLSEQDYLRYLQLLLADHSSSEDILDYFEYLNDTGVQSESLGWYCLLTTQNPDYVRNPQVTTLWKGVYSLLNGNYKLARKHFDNEKESNLLHGCYQICWMLEGISGNEGYWKAPYQNKNCGILGTLHRVLTILSKYTAVNSMFPAYDDIEELSLFVQYPLIRAIINFQDSLQHETTLSNADYSLLKNLSPWVAVPFCQGKTQTDIDTILQDTFKNFPSNHQFKEYAHQNICTNSIVYFLPEDGALYQAALRQANLGRRHPLPERILTNGQYTEKIELLPLGGTCKIGASCFLLTYRGFRILLDCGIDPTQSSKDVYAGISALNCNIDAIIISHAHLDHSGAVPAAHEAWPEAKIYATSITEMFLEHLYADMAKVKNDPSGAFEIENISYNREVMQDALAHIEVVKCEQWIQLAKEIRFRFHSAGHLLGAAMIELCVNKKTILYTGDWSSHEQSLTPTADYKNLPFEPDLLLCEATYMKKITSDWKQCRDDLEKAILDGIQSNQSILLPANAMGRSQELACLIGEMKNNGSIPAETELWLAGMASAITLESACFMNEAYANVIGQYRIFDGSNWPEQNCIVIASSATLAAGSASAQIRKHWAENQIPCRIIHNGGWHTSHPDPTEVIFSCPLPTHASCSDIKSMIRNLHPKSVAFVHQGGKTADRPQLLAALHKEICQENHNDVLCYNLTEQQLVKPFDILYMLQKGTCYDG